MKKSTLFAALLAAAVHPSAAFADPFAGFAGAEQHRAAFAGAVLRLEPGGRADPEPQARLGIGFTRYERQASGALVGRSEAALPLEAGLAGGRPELFVGGESLPEIERRLGADGSTTTILLVIGGLAAGGAALLLLTGGDDVGDGGNPCPPGVEVCAF